MYHIAPESRGSSSRPCAVLCRPRHDVLCARLSFGNNQGIDDVGYGKISDIYFPPKFLVLVARVDCAGHELRHPGASRSRDHTTPA